MYRTRSAETRWSEASRQFPVALLTGARQVGKTTMLRRLSEPSRRVVTLDDPTQRALANEDPAFFLQRFLPPLLIDEIQYAPKLLPYIKIAVDRDRRPGQWWLTGSQQLQMMKGVSESMAGRVAILNLLGFSGRERRELDLDLPPFVPTEAVIKARAQSCTPRSLQQTYVDIWLGSLPALVSGEIQDRDLFFSSYLETYLQRDVKQLAQVGSELGFLRFLRACAARTAQLLNLSDLARDADVSVNTAKSWLSILKASHQVFLLEPYHSNVTKRLVKAPKLYFLDTGLCAYLTEWSSPRTLEAGALSGAIFETHVLGELLKSWWHRGRRPQLHYYRDRDGNEIDFVLLEDDNVYPLEVKRSSSPRAEWTRVWDQLERLGLRVGDGGVVCLCSEVVPLTRSAWAIPVGLI